MNPVAVPVRDRSGAEYGLAITDQRHRAVFNGIWQMGYGFQLSGLYFFGSGSASPPPTAVTRWHRRHGRKRLRGASGDRRWRRDARNGI